MQAVHIESEASRQWIDVTDRVQAAVEAASRPAAAVLVYCPHTTAAVTVNEGWDPDVAGDLVQALDALVPRIGYRHAEGNSPAHLLASLVGVSVVVPLDGGRLRLGRWQRIFLCEFDGPRRRTLWVVPLGA